MFIFLYLSGALMVGLFILRFFETRNKEKLPKYFLSERIIHWGVLFLLLGLLGTAIMNTLYYSKEAIMTTFDFSMPLVGMHDVDLSSQLFIARYERRVAWDHHFVMGIMLLAILIPWTVSFITRKRKTSGIMKFTFWSFFAIFMGFTFTGLTLHIYNFVEFVDYDFRENCRTIHHYLYYATYAWLAFHIIYIVQKVVRSKADIIAPMIHGGKLKPIDKNNKDIKDVK